MYEVDLRSYFNPETIAKRIETVPSLPDWALDKFYPESNRVLHPFPVLGIDELQTVVKNMPLIKRGTESTPLVLGSKGLKYLEAQTVSPSSFVGAKELNDIKILGDVGRENWVNRKIDLQRQAVQKTTGALACQSLSGKLSYPIRLEGGNLDTWEVDFGDVQTASVPLVWDDASITIGSVWSGLLLQKKAIQRNSGYGTNIEWYAGDNAFIALMNLITAMANDKRIDSAINVSITESYINIGGFKIMHADGGYTDLATDAWVDCVETDTVKAIATDAPFTLFYCALDSIKANLEGLPFFVDTVLKEDPEGYKIIGMSKPVPVPIPLAICDMEVL